MGSRDDDQTKSGATTGLADMDGHPTADDHDSSPNCGTMKSNGGPGETDQQKPKERSNGQPTPPATEDLTTRVFRWFSVATSESLGAVGVGLAATTYFVLGRVGLVLMGAFGGVVLFVAWEARHPDVTRAIHGETGPEALARILEYRQSIRTDKTDKTDKNGKPFAPSVEEVAVEQTALEHAFDGFRPETRGALHGFVDAVIRDYVQWWYDPIVPSDRSFALSCRRVLTSFLVTVSNHLSRKRPADTFLDFLTNSSSIVIVFFSELATAFSEMPDQSYPPSNQQDGASVDDVASSTVAAADAVYNYLASNPDSHLASLLNQRQQASKLRMVSEDLLRFLDQQSYEYLPAHTFLREIMATAVLETTLQTCSKPEWINGWIVHLLEAGEPDFSQAIDEGMQTGGSSSSSNNNNNHGTQSPTRKQSVSAASPESTANSTTYFDLDGNVGSMAVASSHRSSIESDSGYGGSGSGSGGRRKDLVTAQHKRQLSRADEEVEAMEEMKRMNQMIADEDARRRDSVRDVSKEVADKDSAMKRMSTPEVRRRLDTAMLQNINDLEAPSTAAADTENGSRESDRRASIATARGTSTSSATATAESSPSTSTTTSVVTPRSSTGESETKETKETATDMAQFTSFDQLVPPGKDEDESSEMGDKQKEADTAAAASSTAQKSPSLPPPPLTLHNATITIHDEPVADKGRLKSRPTWDFLVQIEPANAHYPGWMIVRKYSDFETLHEVLRRIATISGATVFTEQHGLLPSWKTHTRGSLRGDLERYMRDACSFQSLAESEGMKRFLDKDTNMPGGARGGGGNGNRASVGLQAFENMGKNMLDVLSSAPKGVAEGGKNVVGGMVTGVLGSFGGITGLGQKRQHGSTPSLAGLSPHTEGSSSGNGNGSASAVSGSGSSSGSNNNTVTTPTSSVLQDVTAYTNRLSISTPPRVDSNWRSRDSLDSQRSRSSVVSSGRLRSSGQDEVADASGVAVAGTRGRPEQLWADHGHTQSLPTSNLGSRASSVAGRLPRSPSTMSLRSERAGRRLSLAPTLAETEDNEQLQPRSASSTSPLPSPGGFSSGQPESLKQQQQQQQQQQPQPQTKSGQIPTPPPWKPAPTPTSYTKQYAGISEGETRVAVELLFAVINELYTLSSAWNIRRTLLAAAKSFLLRPGNPSLTSMQRMLQSSLLDSMTSDAGLAAQLRQVRENCLPTETERAAWPAPMTAEEKERLRVKARRLLVESGVPAALMGVMGQTATADALGRLFDCLQIEEVARGLLFGVLLQAARIVTH